MSTSTERHDWPADTTEHMWGPWMTKKGPPGALYYRVCVHPTCRAHEEQAVPNA